MIRVITYRVARGWFWWACASSFLLGGGLALAMTFYAWVSPEPQPAPRVPAAIGEPV